MDAAGKERDAVFQQIARLIDEHRQCNRLPPIQIDDVRIARRRRIDTGIHRLIVRDGVVVRFVRTALQAEPEKQSAM